MLVHCLEHFTHAGQQLEHFLAVPRKFVHGFHVAFAQVMDALANVFVSEAFMFQSFADDMRGRVADAVAELAGIGFGISDQSLHRLIWLVGRHRKE